MTGATRDDRWKLPLHDRAVVGTFLRRRVEELRGCAEEATTTAAATIFRDAALVLEAELLALPPVIKRVAPSATRKR